MNSPTSIEQLQKSLKELQSVEFKWNDSKAKRGRCENYEDHDSDKEDVNELTVIELLGRDEDERPLSYCKKHWTKERFSKAKSVMEDKMTEIKEELAFRDKLTKVTRFAQIKDLVDASKAIISRKQESYDHPIRFSDKEKRQVSKLLKLLRHIEPKSSQFMDRGIAINENLWLSGTAHADTYSSRPDFKIHITAIDEMEHYRTYARVRMTLGEAERLRGLITECVEHVRIKGLIAQIEEKFEDIEDDEDEDDQ